MYECFICSPAAAALELFFSVVAGHPFKAWISAVVQNKDGEAEGHRRCDERMCWESLVEGERERKLCQSGVAEPVWPGARTGTGPTRRQCVASLGCIRSQTAAAEGGALVRCTFACGVVGF